MVIGNPDGDGRGTAIYAALSANGTPAGKPQPDPWRGLTTSWETRLTAPMRKVQAEVDALP